MPGDSNGPNSAAASEPRTWRAPVPLTGLLRLWLCQRRVGVVMLRAQVPGNGTSYVTWGSVTSASRLWGGSARSRRGWRGPEEQERPGSPTPPLLTLNLPLPLQLLHRALEGRGGQPLPGSRHALLLPHGVAAGKRRGPRGKEGSSWPRLGCLEGKGDPAGAGGRPRERGASPPRWGSAATVLEGGRPSAGGGIRACSLSGSFLQDRWGGDTQRG